MTQKTVEIEEIKKKIARYCAFQERCKWEAKKKLEGYSLNEKQKEGILNWLVEHDFINELRFSKSFTRGKFFYNNWGKEKIIYGLRSKGLSEALIKKGLEEINSRVYKEKILSLIEKKLKSTPTEDPHIKKLRLTQFLRGKGYEVYVVGKILREEFPL